MECEAIKSRGKLTLKLAGGMSIADVAEARERIVEGMSSHKSLALDISGVQEFDTAAVQLLISLRKTVDTEAKQFSLIGIGPDFISSLERIGVNSDFYCGQNKEVVNG